jgi:ABC-type dipeptide/oligopeptide/nickel transport system permease component
MLRYTAYRLKGFVWIALFVTFASFCLLKIAPGDPALILLQQHYAVADSESLQSARHQLGLDRPFLAQYLSWMGNVLRGDLGVSYYNGVSVAAEIRRAFPVTMQLTLASLLSALTVALFLGILAGLREGGLPDMLTRGLAVLGTCVPSFWLGLALMFLFAVKLDLLPAVGKEGAASFILPAATLAFGPAVFHARLLDASLKETTEEDYVLFARSKGLSEWQVLIYHRLKPSLIPMLTSFGLTLGLMLGGTIIVENIFAWPGMGTLVVEAIFNRDYPIVQAYVLVMAAVNSILNLITDLFCALLDPRVGTGAAT